MAKKRLLWQLYPSYLIITILALVLVSFYASRSIRSFYYKEIVEDLRARAQLASERILPVLRQLESNEVDRLCKELGGLAAVRLTVILPDGRVAGDTDEQPAQMENHGDRPEFIEAMSGDFGSSVRYSDTLGKNMMYVALAVREQSRTLAVVRASIPVTAVDQTLADIYAKIAWAGIAAAGCAAGITLLVSRRITRPIEQMKEAARHFASGQLDHRIPVPESSELAELAKSLNETARRLQVTINTITRQRNRLEAVLASMAEGVVAVDPRGHLVSINKAASGLLDIDAGSAVGRNVEEVIRDVDIQRFIQETLTGTEPTDADVVLRSAQPLSLHLRGTRLSDEQGNKSGAVIVLSDMTLMHRLENVRRDFVANVSHELRTPVTSIKGFVETLLEGAINEPQQAQRFLKIISDHTNRLIAIIDDLLSLSRLEEDGKARIITHEKTKVCSVLASAIELCKPKAEQKQIQIGLNCDEHIEVPMNATLVEQAVFNLVDNAIKYSNPECTVQVIAETTADEVTIAVKDSGCGIEKKHLERIFERFYVADKARSRKLGGTGLGLSIVKHIAQLHCGSVMVESIPGRGSTFTLHLPIR